MSNTVESNAKCAIEVEWSDGSPEYFSVDAVVLSGDFVRLEVNNGAVIEVLRSEVSKILIMRTKDSPKSNKKKKVTRRRKKADD